MLRKAFDTTIPLFVRALEVKQRRRVPQDGGGGDVWTMNSRSFTSSPDKDALT